MPDLIIAGAGGFGRELAAYARDASFRVTGFLDDDPEALLGREQERGGAELRGAISAYEPRADEQVAIGIGHVGARLRIAELLIARGARLATVVHPTAWVAPTARLGDGVAVAPFVCIGPAVRVGELTLLNTYSSLGHDATTGRCCVLASYSVATGFTTLEDEVFLASHAVVTPGQRVRARARVSAGAVVFDEVPPGSLAHGNPARSRAVPEGVG